MMRVSSLGLARMSLGLIFLLAGMGCASTSDLKQLDQGLSQKLETLDGKLQTQVGDLRTDLKTAQAAQETSLAALSDEINRRLHSIEQAVANVQHLPSLVTNLGAKIRAFRRTLFETYELEEVALRNRLKALEQFRIRLKPLPAESAPAPAPSAAMTAPRVQDTSE